MNKIINIHFCCFWKEFYLENQKQLFIEKFFKNIPLKDVDNIDSADIIVVGSFISNNYYNQLLDSKKIKLYYISEPIEHTNKLQYNLIVKNKYDFVFGCINNNIIKNFYKNSLYFFYLYLDKQFAELFNTNEYVKTTNLNDKKFCCLINSHDAGKTRTPIYNELKNINYIDCPGRLYNNCSNKELNKVGNVKFLNQYLFNICPENYKCSLPGYITEKLLNASLGGAIPIYFGSFDEFDEKIFNKNRIIFYDPFNPDSLKETNQFINELFNDKQKLEVFYRQDVFCKTAIETINEMTLNIQNKILDICNKINN